MLRVDPKYVGAEEKIENLYIEAEHYRFIKQVEGDQPQGGDLLKTVKSGLALVQHILQLARAILYRGRVGTDEPQQISEL